MPDQRRPASLVLTKLLAAAITILCIIELSSNTFLKQCHSLKITQLSFTKCSKDKNHASIANAFVTPGYHNNPSIKGDGSICVYSSFFSDALNNIFGNNKNSNDDATATHYPLVLLEIPVKEMKVGGLRFVLGLHLMGKRNTPEVGSWKVTQANDGVLDVLYTKDETASFSITFLEKKIILERWGTAKQVPPSLQYQLQESILLHSILDELETLAAYGNHNDENNNNNDNKNSNNNNPSDQNNKMQEDIQESDRLLTLIEPGDAIQKARSKLPARSEEKKAKI